MNRIYPFDFTQRAQPELVIFIGPQAAGKSTYYRARLAQTHILVSKDRLHNNRRPARRQRTLIEEALSSNQSVVVDNTNQTAAIRRELIELGHEHGARIVGCYFVSTLTRALARNRVRDAKTRVPDFAIASTFKRLERPSLDEGFHELRLVKALFDEMFFESAWEPATLAVAP
jgi:predicted kinase